MSARLVFPDAAARLLQQQVARSWAERVTDEYHGHVQRAFEVGLRPGVSGSAAVARLGFEHWAEWNAAWRAMPLREALGAHIVLRDIRVAGLDESTPYQLSVGDLQSAEAVLAMFGSELGDAAQTMPDIDRARDTARRLAAADIEVTAGRLKMLQRLARHDLETAFEALQWLQTHTDLGGWTTRQLPVPNMESKWWPRHQKLLSELSGRTLSEETKPRLSVAHLTYADPSYRETGGRRHDSWTAGDTHRLAYQPRIVLIVENRDCRLWFPEFPGLVVVEGEGKAATSLLASNPWVRAAERIVYWGDIDSDGYAILNHLRGAVKEWGGHVDSILMDDRAYETYARFGVNRDAHGQPLGPCSHRLNELLPHEAAAYASVATAGDVSVRRIEQERIPVDAAVAALRDALGISEAH